MSLSILMRTLWISNSVPVENRVFQDFSESVPTSVVVPVENRVFSNSAEKSLISAQVLIEQNCSPSSESTIIYLRDPEENHVYTDSDERSATPLLISFKNNIVPHSNEMAVISSPVRLETSDILNANKRSYISKKNSARETAYAYSSEGSSSPQVLFENKVVHESRKSRKTILKKRRAVQDFGDGSAASSPITLNECVSSVSSEKLSTSPPVVADSNVTLRGMIRDSGRGVITSHVAQKTRLRPDATSANNHTEDLLYACGICNAKFKLIEELINHVNQMNCKKSGENKKNECRPGKKSDVKSVTEASKGRIEKQRNKFKVAEKSDEGMGSQNGWKAHHKKNHSTPKSNVASTSSRMSCLTDISEIAQLSTTMNDRQKLSDNEFEKSHDDVFESSRNCDIRPTSRKRQRESSSSNESEIEQSHNNDSESDGNADIRPTSRKRQRQSSFSDEPETKKTRAVKHNAIRPCLYCGKMQTNLNRHVLLVHKSENLVIQAKQASNKDKLEILEKIRKLGIFKHNQAIVANENGIEEIHRERQNRSNDDKTVCCTACYGFYTASYFSSHRRRCSVAKDSAVISAQPLKTQLLESNLEVPMEFKLKILTKFHDNDIRRICNNDGHIVRYGAQIYNETRQKKDKQMESKKTVMSDMRRLAHLFTIFKTKCEEEKTPISCTSSADMLHRKNFKILKEAITEYTTNKDGEETIKAGLKNAIYFLLLKFAKIQKAAYLIEEKDLMAAETDIFLDIFKTYGASFFNDAKYQLCYNRFSKSIRPQEMPLESTVKKLRDYTVGRIAELLKDPYQVWTKEQYVELRDLTVCRLTFFNGRRGNEAARMKIKDWTDACSGAWMDPSRNRSGSDLTEVEKRCFGHLKITYISGKGDLHLGLVSVIFPADCDEALAKLADKDVQSNSDIHPANDYLFPCTNSIDTRVMDIRLWSVHAKMHLLKITLCWQPQKWGTECLPFMLAMMSQKRIEPIFTNIWGTRPAWMRMCISPHWPRHQYSKLAFTWWQWTVDTSRPPSRRIETVIQPQTTLRN